MLRAREEEEALRGARADRDAGRRTSRLRYRIDHGDALLVLQRRRAQDEPGQGLEWPSAASPNCRLPPGLESEDTLLLARLLLCHRHLDSRTHDLLLRATVKVALASEQTREREP